MRGTQRLFARRVLAVLSFALVALGVTAAPASAHTVGGVNATNYRTRILWVHPVVEGVELRVIENGARLELANHTGRDVIVVGYDDEPYLRVGPRGVFENVRSPATYINRTRAGTQIPPARADPTATPQWRKVDGGRTARWHDHRAHWMGTTAPPSVTSGPDHAHLIQKFTLVLRRGATEIRVHGDVWWIPGPSPWPWIAIAIAVAAGVALAARTRFAARVIGVTLAVSLLAAVAHATGSWSTGTTSTTNRITDVLPTAGAVVLGVIALAQLARRGLRAAAPLLVFAGLFLGIAVGLADFGAFTHSQLPTELAPDLDRLTIALALGGGIGATVGAAFHVADRPDRHGRGAGGPPAPRPLVAPGPGNENQSQPMISG